MRDESVGTNNDGIYARQGLWFRCSGDSDDDDNDAADTKTGCAGSADGEVGMPA